MDSKSLLLVCKKELLRTLITMDIDKSKLFFIGSCGDKESLIRFCKIYKPEVILFVVQEERRNETFDLISTAKEASSKSRIVVVDEGAHLYHTGLYIRYGAQAVYDTISNVNSLVDEVFSKTKVNRCVNISPVIKTDKSDMPEFKGVSIAIYQLYMLYLTDYRLVRILNFIDYAGRLVPSGRIRKLIKSNRDKFLKMGLLPKNKWLLTCYPLIFPEKYNRIRHRVNKNKCFIYSLDPEVRKYIQKHSKKQKKVCFLEENKVKFQGLTYKYDDISSHREDFQNDKK